MKMEKNMPRYAESLEDSLKVQIKGLERNSPFNNFLLDVCLLYMMKTGMCLGYNRFSNKAHDLLGENYFIFAKMFDKYIPLEKWQRLEEIKNILESNKNINFNEDALRYYVNDDENRKFLIRDYKESSAELKSFLRSLVGDKGSVLDVTCSESYNLLDVFESDKILGLVENEEIKENLILLALMQNKKINVEVGNLFSLAQSCRKKFDRIYAYCPSIHIDQKSRDYMDFINFIKNDVCPLKTSSPDWIVALASLPLLENGGKLVMITTKGAFFSKMSAIVREYFLRGGGYRKLSNCLIEKIVLFPSRFLPDYKEKNTKDEDFSFAIVLGKNETNQIVFENKITGKHFEKTSFDLLNDKNFMKTVNFYQCFDVPKDDFLKLDEVLLKKNNKSYIFRGPSISENDIEDYKTDDPRTSIRYMPYVALEEGMINKEYLIGITHNSFGKEDKVAQYGDLLLSKTGDKVAVIDFDDCKLLPNSGVYILRLDPKKYNAYFLKYYLETDDGQKALRDIMSGTKVPTIIKENLVDLKLPKVKIEFQNKFGDIYKGKILELREKEEELNNLKLETARILEDQYPCHKRLGELIHNDI